MAEDISPEVIKKTQKILGKYVKKPALTDKLLKKPPFRFLHDIVISVIKETGFLKGLFSTQELISENVKEKEAKVAFLNKLIDAVKSVTKTDLTVRANKIVAGLEPLKTNLFLQAIGKAIEDKIDTTEYITQLSSGQVDTTEKKKLKKSIPKRDDKGKTSKTKNTDDSSNKVNKAKKINDSPRSKTKANTPKDSSRDKNKLDKKNVTEKEKIKEGSKKEVVVEVTTPKQSTIMSTDVDQSIDKVDNQSNKSDNQIKVHEQEGEREHEKITENSSNSKALESVKAEILNKQYEDINNQNPENKQVKSDTRSSRPKSAHPNNENESVSTIKQKNINVDKDEPLKPLQITAHQPQRPKSSLRPPSVRPSSARPGAPRLRLDSALPLQESITMGNINVIIENVDNMDDEETVVIQTTSEVAEENFNSLDVSKSNKGQLVEQILEQIQEEGEGLKKKVDIDWEQDALHNKDGAAKEVNHLRSLIQTLTRTANPLGKIMNYLHEDIDAMHGELQMWTNIKNQLFKEIYKQKRLSVESNKPLLAQLEHLQDEIMKQQQEILVVRSNILRCELRIKELLNV